MLLTVVTYWGQPTIKKKLNGCCICFDTLDLWFTSSHCQGKEDQKNSFYRAKPKLLCKISFVSIGDIWKWLLVLSVFLNVLTALSVTMIMKCQWLWNIGGIISTEENLGSWWEISPSSTQPQIPHWLTYNWSWAFDECVSHGMALHASNPQGVTYHCQNCTKQWYSKNLNITEHILSRNKG